MPITALGAASSSDSASFSVPVLVVAAAVAWVALVLALAVWRRAARVEGVAPTQDLPPVSPAVAGLLCDDFELPAELPPATLLDLAARRVVRLEEVAPRRTICRVRRAADEPLTPYEQRVLDEVAQKVVDGVVPTDALTTGTEDASRGWHRAFDKEVIAEAQDRGLTKDVGRGVGCAYRLGPFVVGALLYAASAVGGDGSWRVRREIYDAYHRGDAVEAVYTPKLGYVREMRAAGSVR